MARGGILDLVPRSTDGKLADYRADLYAKQAWYGIGLFLFIIGLFNWSSILYSKFSVSRHSRDMESLATPRPSSVSLRRLPVALLNAYRVIVFRWTLHIGETLCLSTAEITLTVAYIVYMYVWGFINTTNLEGEKLDRRYWSIRLATIATSQFPLITVLAAKNNLVSLITGVSFERLVFLHRMMARVVFTMLWAHSGIEIMRKVGKPIHAPSLICGITATVAFSVIVILSLRPVRKVAYEFFFYAHCILVLVFLICAYFHAAIGPSYQWVWPTFVLWGFDRVIRAIRLIIFNHSYFGFFSRTTMNATIELQSEEYVRLRLCRPPNFHWSPGQMAYLIIPSVSRLPFEAHPFTIASIDSVAFHSTCTTEKSTSGRGTKDAEKSPTVSSPFWNELVFFINVRKGFTSQLKKAATKGKKVKAFIDGPYGIPPDLRTYDTSILIAGATGISYILPTFLHIVESVKRGKSSCRKVVFVWATRDESFIDWVNEPLCKALQLVPSSLAVSIRIHITCKKTVERNTVHDVGQEALDHSDSDTGSISQEGTQRGDILAFESIKIENGRPDLVKMLSEEVQSATGKLSVSACCSPGMAKTVKQALRFPVSSPSNVLHGGPSVSLFVEPYGYA